MEFLAGSFLVLWRLIWCFGAASTAVGRFFRKLWLVQERTLRGCVWMLSSSLAGAVFVGGCYATCCGLRVWWVWWCVKFKRYAVARL